MTQPMNQARHARELTDDLQRERWDAIVIGSGLGGLTTALGMAVAGRRVLVLEQHFVPGGYATSFRRKSFVFDASLHQMSGLAEGCFVREVLAKLGVLGRIQPVALDSTFVVKSPLGDLPVGPDYLRRLEALFPRERQALHAFDALIDRVRAEVPRLFRQQWIPDPFFTWLGRATAPAVHELRNKTLADCLGAFGDPSVRNLIAVQWGYFGLPLSRISALLYLIAWGGFLREGIHYIKGTSQALANAFVDRLAEERGVVLVRHRVERILVEKGRVTGVVCRSVRKDGGGVTRELRAPVVVSNADPFVTFRQMLPDVALAGAAENAKLDALEPSASAFCVYIGLDCPLEDLTKDDHHAVAFMDDGPLDPDRFFSDTRAGRVKGIHGYTVYSRMDPDLAPPGKSCLTALRLDFIDAWRGLDRAAYLAKKAQAVGAALDDFERRYPGFRSHVEVLDAATPLTMRRYTSNHDGAINGFAYTPQRVGMGMGGLRPRSPLRGLYLAGAWSGAMSGGYSGSIVNGFMTAGVIDRTAPRAPG